MIRNVNPLFSLIGKCNYSAFVTPQPQKNPEIIHTQMFINNEWHKSKSGRKLTVENPSTGNIIAQTEHGCEEDIDFAVKSAQKAFQLNSPWRQMDASERGLLLFKLADLIQRDASYISSLETLNSGKTFLTAYHGDITNSIKTLRYMAGYCDKTHGKTIPMDGQYFAYTRVEPVGTCGQIIPWNFPFMMAVWKIASALAMGNTVVLKPAQQTPLTALYLGSLIQEAGIPPGVVNIVPGDGATGSSLVSHQGVDKIAFTGSTEVGLKIQQLCGVGRLKRSTLELGGKSPLIILPDADLKSAVEMAHFAVFVNNGQMCCSGTRTFVHESIYDEFVQLSVELAKKRTVGDPFDFSIEQGPQISRKQFDRVFYYIKEGQKQGAKLCTGGQRFGNIGYFIQPTVFCDVEDDNLIARDEIFGPVQTILKFSDLDEVIRRANGTKYGLAAGIFSQCIDQVNYLIQGLQAGMVWVNTYNTIGPQVPVGGFKESGCGREMGLDGLADYCEIKTVMTKLLSKNS